MLTVCAVLPGVEDFVISGDTRDDCVFRGGVGRMDFKRCDERILRGWIYFKVNYSGLSIAGEGQSDIFLG